MRHHASCIMHHAYLRMGPRAGVSGADGARARWVESERDGADEGISFAGLVSGAEFCSSIESTDTFRIISLDSQKPAYVARKEVE